MNPLEVAKHFIRQYVERGDTVEWISSTWMGSCCKDYHVSIGGWIRSEEELELLGSDDPNKYKKLAEIRKTRGEARRVPNTKILVERANGVLVNQVFSLAEIYRMVDFERNQIALAL